MPTNVPTSDGKAALRIHWQVFMTIASASVSIAPDSKLIQVMVVKAEAIMAIWTPMTATGSHHIGSWKTSPAARSYFDAVFFIVTHQLADAVDYQHQNPHPQ